MGTLQDLLEKLTELRPDASLILPNARVSLIYPTDKQLGKDGFEKVGGGDSIRLSISYNGSIVILKKSDNCRITTTGTWPGRVFAECTCDWSLAEGYVRTTAPDGSDEPPELRIYNKY